MVGGSKSDRSLSLNQKSVILTYQLTYFEKKTQNHCGGYLQFYCSHPARWGRWRIGENTQGTECNWMDSDAHGYHSQVFLAASLVWAALIAHFVPYTA